ncbi:MAG: flagellar brake protein [Cellvibrionaceae bacterium]|nr:flagellar brake protein [Cellvibrionaceae bacterium]
MAMALWQQVFQLGRAQPLETAKSQPRLIPEAVLGQLRRWQRQRQLIEVKTPRQGEYQQSLILAVKPEQGCFEIDELFPGHYHGQIQAGDALHLRLNQGGQVQEMDCKVLDYHSDSAMPYYSLALPERIHAGQRRKQRRIAISEDFPITVSLQTNLGERLHGSAENISAGGLRLRLAGNQLKELQAGAFLPQCELNFPGGLRLNCSARIKGLQFKREPHRHTSVSICFGQMEPANRDTLNGLVDAIYQRCQDAA